MKRLWFALVVAGLLFAGCGTFGKNFNEDRVKDIKVRATTMEDILDWFGVPYKEGIENGNIMWTYQFDKYVMGETKSKDLVILFNQKNFVKAYRYTSNLGDN